MVTSVVSWMSEFAFMSSQGKRDMQVFAKGGPEKEFDHFSLLLLTLF